MVLVTLLNKVDIDDSTRPDEISVFTLASLAAVIKRVNNATTHVCCQTVSQLSATSIAGQRKAEHMIYN